MFTEIVFFVVPKSFLPLVSAHPKVGCFGLTEAFAGVNSGMIVNTTATWSPEKQMFLIQCPDRGAYKNWISQGLVADMCVVMATLHVGL